MKTTREYLMQEILTDIKLVEQMNHRQNKPWNYQLKELGQKLISKSDDKLNNDLDDFSCEVYNFINHGHKN